MLKSIFDIGGHMIRARVFEVIGDHESANEEMFHATLIVENDAYEYAFKNVQYGEPSYLDTYPELRQAWETGHAIGVFCYSHQHGVDCEMPEQGWMSENP